MTRLRLAKIDEYHFLTCLKHSLWGSNVNRFKDWQAGEYLAFIVDKSLAGLAEVTDNYFVSEEEVWDTDLYPYRVPIQFTHVLDKENRVPILGKIRDTLISEWGKKYGLNILNHTVIEDESLIKIKKIKLYNDIRMPSCIAGHNLNSPSSSLKAASMHKKQPPANVAFS